MAFTNVIFPSFMRKIVISPPITSRFGGVSKLCAMHRGVCKTLSTKSVTTPTSTIHDTNDLLSQEHIDLQNETIYALATGSTAAAGVAIMRISGPAATHALRSLLNPTGKRALPRARTATLRTLHHPVTAEMLDRALILYFPHPHSFTTEDVVELHLHGSRAVIGAIMDALDAIPPPTPRPATRGEFTRRAFENGAMDLVGVEALADLIAAETSAQRRQALRALSGDAAAVVQDWRKRLVDALAHIEAVLDFADDVGDAPLRGLLSSMTNLRQEMTNRLSEGKRAEIVRAGARIAIIGPPNAGKSSLLNALAHRPAAIVAPTAGTTRDIIDIRMDLAGIAVTVSDTAGLRTNPADDIEIEGMRRAQGAATSSDVIICVYDASSRDLNSTIQATQHTLVEAKEVVVESESDSDVKSPHIVYVFNKMDLCNNEISNLKFSTPEEDTFKTTLKNGHGVGDLVARVEAILKTRLETETLDAAETAPVVTRSRHRHHVRNAICALTAFIEGQTPTELDLRMPMDLAAEDIRSACKEVGAITGIVSPEEVLDVIFSEFCIGK